MNICYVIASYAGDRRTVSDTYLRRHVSQILKHKNSIGQIVIVRPKVDYDRDGEISLHDISESLYDLGELKKYVFILDRPVNDRSFGQYLYAYKVFRDYFTHYIIVEDDYCPATDNFDTKMIELMDESDYLCSYYGSWKEGGEQYAIIPNGIVRESAFAKIFQNTPNYDEVFKGCQDGQECLLFSKLFTDNDLVIAGYQDKYSVPYRHRDVEWIGDKKDTETIFVPQQLIYG